MEEFKIKIADKEIIIQRDIDGKFIKPDIVKDLETKGTATKPAHEPICMARKPLSEKTIVENVLKHGTGAICIDGCRIPIGEGADMAKVQSGQVNKNKGNTINTFVGGENGSEWKPNPVSEQGRFPANIICTDDALNDGVMTKSMAGGGKKTGKKYGEIYGYTSKYDVGDEGYYTDSGSKSRYFDIDQWWKKLIDTSSTLLLSGFQDVAVCSGLWNSNAYTYSEYDAEQLLRNADKVWGSVASYNSLRTYLLSNEGLCVESLKALRDFLGDYPNNSHCDDELAHLCEGISPEFSQLLNDVHIQVRLSLHSGGLDNIFGCSDHQKPYSLLVMLIILPIIIKIAREVKQKDTFNQEVWAEKHGLLQFPKASKAERNKGLDKLVLVDIMEVCKEKNITNSVKLAQLLVGMEQSLPKVTAVSGTQNKSVIEWSTEWFGKDLMEKYQEVCKSTILTETHSITTLSTFKWLLHLLTNEYIADVSLETATGGNLVGSAENYSELIITISEKMALALGVKNVQSPTQLKISVSEGKSGHPTVKPVHLLCWLVRLVTPPDGVCLDPFAGSFTTGVACKMLGCNFIGIEMDADYCAIGKARMDAVKPPQPNLFDEKV